MKRNYSCCVCEHTLEEHEIGLEFVKFTDARTPLYKKLYAYSCPECHCYRQVKDKGDVI